MARINAWWLCALLPILVGCGGGDEEGSETCGTVDKTYNPAIDPANFVASVTNPLFPLVPGTNFKYTTGTEDVDINVLSDTKTILGVTCTVVHDVASVKGETIEDTYDWIAQDKDGAVWYFGEDTKEYKAGKVISTEGSWEAGKENAKPGTIIPAKPELNLEYRQEYKACEAEDMGMVLSLNEAVAVQAGSYTGCMKTKDYTPLEPSMHEEKYYCPNYGLVLSVDIVTGEREELIAPIKK